MKRYSYKVEFLPIEGEEGARRIDKTVIEATLNRYAEEGWRVWKIDICGNLGLVCVFEREEIE
ncbi:MAG: hypothetical protein C5S38_08370 [Candidatus Methanophagaceae archaeon]|nr:MAG: hypothetical protein C5S38_08370 [Methanophagales archaeon]KAF5432251.1 protein of unknown function (DUF4177) [Methanophagales archaeon]